MLDLTPATFEEFEREAKRGNVVPVVRSVLADLQTPVGAFLRIAGDASHAFLLESIEGGERVARYSFLGANPWMIARGRGAETIVEKNGEREVRKQNAVEFLREYFQGKKLAPAGLAPLSGGASAFSAMTPRAGSSRRSIAMAPSHAKLSTRSGCSFAQSWPSIASGSSWKSLRSSSRTKRKAIGTGCAIFTRARCQRQSRLKSR
jgi:hypothetical protein